MTLALAAGECYFSRQVPGLQRPSSNLSRTKQPSVPPMNSPPPLPPSPPCPSSSCISLLLFLFLVLFLLWNKSLYHTHPLTAKPVVGCWPTRYPGPCHLFTVFAFLVPRVLQGCRGWVGGRLLVGWCWVLWASGSSAFNCGKASGCCLPGDSLGQCR